MSKERFFFSIMDLEQIERPLIAVIDGIGTIEEVNERVERALYDETGEDPEGLLIEHPAEGYKAFIEANSVAGQENLRYWRDGDDNNLLIQKAHVYDANH